MRLERIPKTNDFGLVLPPDALRYSITKPAKGDGISRHHLYWPECNYKADNGLAVRFREHKFNSIWLLRSDHDKIHENYDGVPVPHPYVMEAYLEEANLLETLNVTVTDVGRLDQAIEQRVINKWERAWAQRQQKIETINRTLEQLKEPQIVPTEIAQLALSQAVILAAA